MKNFKLNFEDFETEKLAKNQQKAIRGGDGESDPIKGSGNGNTQQIK